MIASERATLSLAQLEAFDPRAAGHGEEKRFCCPLGACQDKPRDRQHQSLCVNTASGLWLCNRCQATGKLTERWDPRARGQWRREACRRAFRVPPEVEERRPGRAASAPYLQPLLARSRPVAGTPGERYLAGRGIPVAVATAAGVLYTADCYGRPGVIFPLRDQDGELVAVNVRHTDGRDDPKTHSVGDRSLGLFATAGALVEPNRQRVADLPLVVVEGPIDALALAACGVPAVALVATRAPHWLRREAAFREVLLALDADAAGDAGAAVLLAELTPFATSVRRIRPRVGKDWADWLLRSPATLRRALSRLAGSAGGAVPRTDRGEIQPHPQRGSAGAVTLVQAFAAWAALEAADPAGAETTTAGRFYRLVETAGIATDAGPEDDVGPYLEGLAAGEHGEGVAALLAAGRVLAATVRLAGAGDAAAPAPARAAA